MSRLISVSNRVAAPTAQKTAGGLAVGVLSALSESGGIWFGWSGNTTTAEPGKIKRRRNGNIEFVTVDLNEADFDGYYNGFSNNTFWPLAHYLLGYFSYRRRQYDAYRRVNDFLARKLVPLLEPDDLIWVHDYHLIPLAAALRQAGATQPIGFFLHVPFPNFEVLRALPCYADILRFFASYDVVGFQTERDLASFHDCITQTEIGGEVHGGNRVSIHGRTLTADVFPIGIDVDDCISMAESSFKNPRVARLAGSLRDRKLVIGVDRLDYSKGLVLRFRAFETLLEDYPATRRHVVFLQIAPPTRTGVRTYDEIREDLERATGNINGRFAEMDWVPIRYLNQGYKRDLMMSILRLASVGLITPIRDGMNLVAKEFVATQDPADPGIPVLSTLCGAAAELTESVLVNPYDRQAVANGIQTALEMPVEERRERHATMLETLRRNDIHHWSGRFVDALTAARWQGLAN